MCLYGSYIKVYSTKGGNITPDESYINYGLYKMGTLKRECTAIALMERKLERFGLYNYIEGYRPMTSSCNARYIW